VGGSLMSLKSFERELERCKDWKETFKVALKGLVNNKFTLSLNYINETNLPTLEIRNPEAYAAIKNRKVREALVLSDVLLSLWDPEQAVNRRDPNFKQLNQWSRAQWCFMVILKYFRL